MNAQIEMFDQAALTWSPVHPKPPGPIARNAHIEQDRNLRWTLTRMWDQRPKLGVCGLNPSTADGQRDDQTMIWLTKFAWRQGFGGIVMVNVYPWISSSPIEMRKWRDAEIPRSDQSWALLDGYSLGRAPVLGNHDHAAAALKDCSVRVAAWGVLDKLDMGHATNMHIAMQDRGVGLTKCFGLTWQGHPKHPMARGKHRMDPYQVELQPFRRNWPN